MIIRYDVKARYQIEEIFQYGKSNFGSQTALRYIQKLRENINGLKQHPLAGSIGCSPIKSMNTDLFL